MSALPRIHRIKKVGGDIRAILRAPQQVSGGPLSYRSIRTIGAAKCIVSIPARIIPRATMRNTIKRRITEAVRSIITANALKNVSLMIVVRSSEVPVGSALSEELMRYFKKSGIL